MQNKRERRLSGFQKRGCSWKKVVSHRGKIWGGEEKEREIRKNHKIPSAKNRAD